MPGMLNGRTFQFLIAGKTGGNPPCNGPKMKGNKTINFDHLPHLQKFDGCCYMLLLYAVAVCCFAWQGFFQPFAKNISFLIFKSLRQPSPQDLNPLLKAGWADW